MKKKFTTYKEKLMDILQDPDEAKSYLNVALLDDDQSAFLIALRNVLEAQGINITQFSKKSKY